MTQTRPLHFIVTSNLKKQPRVRLELLQLPLAFGVCGVLFSAAAASAQTAAASLPPPPVAQFAKVNDVVVKGHNAAQAATKKLNKIAGGFSVVSSAAVSKGRTQSNADLLKLQPGVIAAATGAGGFDSVKVSIRGSGINNGVGYFRNGIKYEFDDLPITTPSGTPYELFDPQGLDYTEILRGDNAFTTGDLALGGTINYVTNTGRTAPYTELRTELGSFGYVKGSAATGGVSGPWDYYINVIGERQNGWQQHSRSNATHLIANLGYQVSPNIETRVYFRYGEEIFQSPGALTRAQIESNHPTQAQAVDLEVNYRRNQPGSELLGDVTTIHIDDEQTVELGLAYQNFPILIGNSNATAPIEAKWDYGNIAAQIKYTDDAQLLGHGNELTGAAYISDDIYGDAKEIAIANYGSNPYGNGYPYYNQANPLSTVSYYNIKNVKAGEILYQNKFNGSTDETALISDDFEAVKHVWFTLGGGIVATPRKFNTIGNTFTGSTSAEVPTIQTPTFSSDETNLIPRLGLRWDVSQDLQLFSSYGGNVEPREDWAGAYGPYSGTAASTYPNYGILDLKNQITDTAEVGFRGRYGIFQGSADYFHADVSNELLTIYDPVLNINTTINAPPAVHQGVEASLDTLLWQSAPGDYWSANPQVARLHLVQTYDWSDFHFTKGAFGHNQEPGLPEHYYQGELAFDHPSGFYANIDARVSSGVWVDYANTFKAAPYVIYGLTAGWQQPSLDKHGWQVSLSVDNLFNAKYAVAVQPTYSANHAQVANEYPGEGLGVFSSVDYKF